MPNPSSQFALQTRQLSKAASAHLDLIRAFAACAVMWNHLRTLFFVEYTEIANPGLVLKAIYFLTGFGHQAVMVFFVLSGFLISSSIFRSIASGKWSWMEYAIHRSARLYVVLLPGLLLGLLWDGLGSHFFDRSGLYSQPLRALGPEIAKNNLTGVTFLGNLFYLQTIFCRTFGSNGPLWSLANEFWYYVLFPIALFAGIAWVRGLYRNAVFLTVLACSVAYFLGTNKLIGFAIWLTGCVLVLAYSWLSPKSGIVLLIYLALSSVIIAVSLTAARTEKLAEHGADLLVGLAFAIFLFGVLQLDWGARSSVYLRGTHVFAGFSYSLYVLHFPLVLFLRASLTPWKRWQPDYKHLGYGLILGVGVLVFAWAISLFTENKTAIARNWMRTVLSADR